MPLAARSWIALAARLLLGGVFVFAAGTKISDPQTFHDGVKAFKLLPAALWTPTTFMLPWVELVAGLALLLGFWTRAGALILSLLLAGFTLGIVSVLARALSVECGCFGSLSLFCPKTLSTCNIIQNTVLLALGLAVLALGPGRWSVEGFRPASRAAV